VPRDSTGVYTTPAGQPVTGGTTISATVFNALVNDLKAEMTDSLSRTGKGGMSVPLPFADGSVSAPGISFDNETNSGFYRAGSHDIRMTLNGSDVLKSTTSRTGFAGATAGQQVSASSAGFSHTGDTNDTDVTNITVTITTTGRPVMLVLQPDGNTTNDAYIGVLSDAGLGRIATFKLLRDATVIARSMHSGIASELFRIPPGALTLVDTPAAGTYTYKLQVAVDNNAAVVYAKYVVLIAYEL
jgi:hypothetical protein